MSLNHIPVPIYLIVTLKQLCKYWMFQFRENLLLHHGVKMLELDWPHIFFLNMKLQCLGLYSFSSY